VGATGGVALNALARSFLPQISRMNTDFFDADDTDFADLRRLFTVDPPGLVALGNLRRSSG
jgi:hypothetical protein